MHELNKLSMRDRAANDMAQITGTFGKRHGQDKYTIDLQSFLIATAVNCHGPLDDQ